MSGSDRFVEANRRLWDEWADINVRSDLYDLEGFKAGRITIPDYQRTEVGDVSGKSLLHLQCHFGMDTLTWARLGATVTGLDLSERALEVARSLASEIGVEARFVHANVLEADRVLDEQFDVVFTSIGVLGWLPDVPRWAEVVAHFVKPGGRFYICEIHPYTWMFDDESPDPELRFRYPYFSGDEPLEFETQGSYADLEADVKQSVHYGWNHDLGEIVSSLCDNGLRIEFLHEHRFGIEPQFPYMQRHDDGRWYLPGGMPEIPLLFSLRATKD
ncbi:MAG: class I SAM-dependent methyltransferase [Actinomycetota bacterium]